MTKLLKRQLRKIYAKVRLALTDSWLNDGFCDDINNHVTCNYDGGNCCGRSVNNKFCLNCTCKCK